MTTAYNPHRLQSGVYQLLYNTSDTTAMDLAGYDFKYVIGYPPHEGQNQKWEFTPLGQGYSIRSMYNGDYLTIADGINKGTRIIASPYPVSWALEASDFEGGIWCISWPDSPYLIDLAGQGSSEPGTAVQLWTRDSSELSRLWRFVRCEVGTESTDSRTSFPPAKFPGASTADTVINSEVLKVGDDGEITVITTITTTTTTNLNLKVARLDHCANLVHVRRDPNSGDGITLMKIANDSPTDT